VDYAQHRLRADGGGTESGQISAKLKLAAKATTNRKSDNLPATGYNNQSISCFMIFRTVHRRWCTQPANIDKRTDCLRMTQLSEQPHRWATMAFLSRGSSLMMRTGLA
jgi:hypothetical protein